MPEWSNGAVSKTVERASVPRVRIPVSPPIQICLFGFVDLINFARIIPKKVIFGRFDRLFAFAGTTGIATGSHAKSGQPGR